MNNPAAIPLVDLGLQNAVIADQVIEATTRIIAGGGFILGPEVTAFESEFARYCGVSRVVGVGNGTDALELALRAAGVGRGDEVIVPANTFVATAEAVERTGAAVVLVDNDDDYLIDVDSVAEHLTPRTRAVMAVHLYGQTAPVERLRQIVGEDVVIVEDAAQAQGASRNGRRAGSIGDIAGTSFYPGKNLGAFGDAGAVMTDNAEYAERVALLRNHGGERRYEHLKVGMNSRMDSIQASALSAKLVHLDRWNADRRVAAALYAELLADLTEVVLPRIVPGNEHVFHLYVVRVPDRDRVVGTLNESGIGAAIHYPLPVHRLPAFPHLAGGSFPRAEKYAGQLLSLPIYPGITPEQQGRVAEVLTAAVRSR